MQQTKNSFFFILFYFFFTLQYCIGFLKGRKKESTIFPEDSLQGLRIWYFQIWKFITEYELLK